MIIVVTLWIHSLSINFRVFDRDGNGFISRDELQTAMEMIGESLTETQLTELLTIADLDKDGRINYEGKLSTFLKEYLDDELVEQV